MRAAIQCAPHAPRTPRESCRRVWLAIRSVKDLALAELDLLADVVAFKNRFYRYSWARYEYARAGAGGLVTAVASRWPRCPDVQVAVLAILAWHSHDLHPGPDVPLAAGRAFWLTNRLHNARDWTGEGYLDIHGGG